MRLLIVAGCMALSWAWVGCDGGGDGGDNNQNSHLLNQNGNTNTNTNTNTGELEAQATVNVSGAQFESWSLDDVVNSVYCLEAGPGDFLNVNAYSFPGSLDDSFTLTIDQFTGPGTYSYNYDTSMTGDFFADVYVGSLYKYWFFYDYSRLDYHEEYSDCTINISEPEPGWYSGTVSCTFLPATITSADYLDNPVEFQPTVDVSMTFTCSTL